MFRRVASGGHLDLTVLEPGVNEKTGKPRTEITVDQVRKATAFLRLTAAEGGWRIVLVDSADALNANAANALLKILEEPSKQSLLLLVSHAPGRLLPTVRSRCCHLALKPLPEETVGELLRRQLPDLGASEAATLARLADGSIGRALELAEVGGLDLYGELTALLTGLAGRDGEPSAGFDTERLHGFTEKLARGTDLSAFRATRDLLLWWLSRAVRARTIGRASDIVTDGEAPVLSRSCSAGQSCGLARAMGQGEPPLGPCRERQSGPQAGAACGLFGTGGAGAREVTPATFAMPGSGVRELRTGGWRGRTGHPITSRRRSTT